MKSRLAVTPTGIFLGDDTAWVYRSAAGQTPYSASYPHSQNWSALFNRIAADIGPSLIQLVLCPTFYQLVTADKPAVAAEEVAQALLWSVKDMVAMPPQNIHLDYFESSLTNSNKLQVVITDKAVLSAIAQSADAAGMRFAGISVEELMPTNLFADESHARLVISHVPAEDVLLTVVRAGELCMHRRIRGFRELDNVDADALHLGVADNLSLEIQRSMDFFESQLRQPPVAAIDLLVQGATDALVKAVSANFNQPVQATACEQVGAKMAALAFAELQRERA
ncbi:MSHA biogenesis protein MshI [Shewanella dokdonensis]|uniref:MSHA biogenesis protein MshI n=1 Tax=Shewanella dokdonensis TaxID=712036 RepID=A0ABX8DCP8_9GAMM|nr:MSHA biogenesis protein MshI [Shewanella dokdonensis]MCL1075310.1 MSHA biogenesis protein MshI [Shewanella dokdonensis]QVK22026.1 MSHA biogenesis protein MshI [Shewanella dokdonensis]